MSILVVVSIHNATSTGYRNKLTFAGEPETMTLPACRVVCLVDKGYNKEPETVWVQAPLTITSAETGTLTLPADMAQYVQLKTEGDTLQICFDLVGDKSEYSSHQVLFPSTATLALALPVGTQHVSSNMMGQPVTFCHYTADSLAVTKGGWGRVAFEDCRFRALHTELNSVMDFRSGEIRDLYINLDNNHDRWSINVDSFHIDTEHLSGMDGERVELQRGEARRIVWTPLSETATLDVQLQERATIDIR